MITTKQQGSEPVLRDSWRRLNTVQGLGVHAVVVTLEEKPFVIGNTQTSALGDGHRPGKRTLGKGWENGFCPGSGK